MERRAFTLVELSIVLVITGIILGGIVKGSALVEQARYKRIHQDVQQIQAAIVQYMDQYGQLPGDDPADISAIDPGCTGGDGDGAIEWIVLPHEQFCFWKALIFEGYLSGPKDVKFNSTSWWSSISKIAKKNPFGGYYIVWTLTSNISLPSNFGVKVGRTYILMYISERVAKRLDEIYDDGDPGSGAIRKAFAPDPYDPSSTHYIIWSIT